MMTDNHASDAWAQVEANCSSLASKQTLVRFLFVERNLVVPRSDCTSRLLDLVERFQYNHSVHLLTWFILGSRDSSTTDVYSLHA